MSSSLGSSRRSSANSRNTTRIITVTTPAYRSSSSTPASNNAAGLAVQPVHVPASISTASRTCRPSVSVTSSCVPGSLPAARAAGQPVATARNRERLSRATSACSDAGSSLNRLGVPHRSAGRAAARRPDHGPPAAIGDDADRDVPGPQQDREPLDAAGGPAARGDPGQRVSAPRQVACRAVSTARGRPRAGPPRSRRWRRRRRLRRRPRGLAPSSASSALSGSSA